MFKLIRLEFNEANFSLDNKRNKNFYLITSDYFITILMIMIIITSPEHLNQASDFEIFHFHKYFSFFFKPKYYF